MARVLDIRDRGEVGLVHFDLQPTLPCSGDAINYGTQPHTSQGSHLPPCTSGRLGTGIHHHCENPISEILSRRCYTAIMVYSIYLINIQKLQEKVIK